MEKGSSKLLYERIGFWWRGSQFSGCCAFARALRSSPRRFAAERIPPGEWERADKNQAREIAGKPVDGRNGGWIRGLKECKTSLCEDPLHQREDKHSPGFSNENSGHRNG